MLFILTKEEILLKTGRKSRIAKAQKAAAFWLVVVLFVSLVAWPDASAQAATSSYPDVGFGNPAFNNLWYRSDLPVLKGQVSRGLLWGPEQIRKLTEPYTQDQGGYRTVVYYDKGRMEINNPSGDPTASGYVTNGLLAKEMITGAVQLGDNSYRFTSPASDVTVAGDPLESNATAPTFASFSKLASVNNNNRVAQHTGATVQETLAQDGTTSTNSSLAQYKVVLTDYNANLGHNIPGVFSDFFKQQGLINQNGQNTTGLLMDATALIGFPLTEPYWVKTKVAGKTQDVLVQAFERRVLTYTPSNPASFQVEMGNTGRDYWRWRYNSPIVNYNPVTTKDGGIVSTAQPLASQIGLQVLQNGGNAIDAAAAIQFALNVVEPQFSGVGGGTFMIIRLKDGSVHVIDGRESAPAGAKTTMFLDANGKPLAFNTAVQTGMSVGIPGTLKAVSTALSNYGTISLSQAIQPAINLARNGFIVNFNLARNIVGYASRLENRANGNPAADVFLPNGQPLQEGQLLKQPDLANTLQAIATNGPSYLYGDSPFSEALVKIAQARGGSLTINDLKNYNVLTPTPITGTFKGYDIVSMPSPSSGGITLVQMLKLLEPYDLKSMGQNSPDYWHLLIEASHLAFADRGKYIGDQRFVNIPIQGMLSSQYLDTRRALISMDKTNTNVQPGNPFAYQPSSGGSVSQLAPSYTNNEVSTTHFVVADKYGNSVTETTTIEQGFGSGMMVPGFGVMINNEMTDFDFTPGTVNQVEPGKKPRSSMTPTMVFKDNKPYLILGSPGGASIIFSVAETILNVLVFQMPLQQAIEAPRLYSTSYSAGVSWEIGLSKSVRDALAARGHHFDTNPTPLFSPLGSVQAIMWMPDGTMIGAADPRREGTPYAASSK